jgi:hypothetical protein
MTPLIQAPSIIPQLILSFCAVSIATHNKLFENMTLFYWDTPKPKVMGCTRGKTFLWVLDTGSAVNSYSYETAYGKKQKLPLAKMSVTKLNFGLKEENAHTP